MFNTTNDLFVENQIKFNHYDEDFFFNQPTTNYYQQPSFFSPEELLPLNSYNDFARSVMNDIVKQKYETILPDLFRDQSDPINTFQKEEKNGFSYYEKNRCDWSTDIKEQDPLDRTFISKIDDENLATKLFQNSIVEIEEQSFLTDIETERSKPREREDFKILQDINIPVKTKHPKIKRVKKITKPKKKSSTKNHKKKQKVECNCKKSKCLKLYCECFAKGLICGVDCNCKDCHNSEDLKELRNLVIQETLEKNPFAFKSKYKKIKEKKSLLHSRGCNCTKTGCIKKYCECYNAGTGCSRLCRCSNCKNEKIEIKDEEVKLYYDRILRKRKRKSILKDCFNKKVEILKELKKKKKNPL